MPDYENLNINELSENFYDIFSTRPLEDIVSALEEASRRRAEDLRTADPADFDPYLALSLGLRELKQSDFSLDEDGNTILQ